MPADIEVAPAKFITKYLTDSSVLVEVPEIITGDMPADWSGFTNILPSKGENVVSTRDTGAVLTGGRDLDGYPLKQSTVQIRIRYRRYREGWAKGIQIQNQLAQLNRSVLIEVTLPDATIARARISSFIRTTDLTPLGVEEDGRGNLVINGKFTFVCTAIS